MLSWLFKKRGPAATPAPVTAPAPVSARRKSPASAAPSAPPASSAPPPAAPAPPARDWPALLGAAQGDDKALLELALAAPLQHKLAAVQALSGEQALKLAEREFRSHDRKVHRLAKQRLEAAITQREARAKAQGLIERTRSLSAQDAVPINHLVELDREWQALPAASLEAEQCSAFAALRAELDRVTRERADRLQRHQRWLAEIARGLPGWQQSLHRCAEHGVRLDALALGQTLQAWVEARPPGAGGAGLDTTLAEARQAVDWLAARLADLERQAQPPVPRAVALPESMAEARPASAPETAAEAASEVVAAAAPDAAPGFSPEPTSQMGAEAVAQPPADPEQATSAVPPSVTPSPPADPHLLLLIDQRQAQVQRARLALQAPPAAPAPRVEAPRPVQDDGARAQRRQRVDELMQQAEAALAEGQLAPLTQQLAAIDAELEPGGAGALSERQRTRLQALRAERGRLVDWQRWGGARARDDLVAEAEALARQVLPTPEPPTDAASGDPAEVEADVPVDATDEAAIEAPAGQPASPPAAPARKLNLKLHGDQIQTLRKRWKELDRLGAAATQAQWQAFDTALQTAYLPVAAQQAAVKAARQQNLLAREAMLSALEALPLPDAEAPDWKGLVHELDAFQQAWRRQGPVEHTVPAAARATVLQRCQQAVDRLEAPLQQAREQAAAEREQLVEQAEALVRDGGTARRTQDPTRVLRELQAAWQDHARRLPLARAQERTLWTRFRTATEAVFAQRDAVWAEREAGQAAAVAERESLLQRLTALSEQTPTTELARTLGEVDRAWRAGADLPRAVGDALEVRYRSARAAAARWQEAGARQRWQAHCDTLSARLDLCEAREQAGVAGEELDARWAGAGVLSALPAPWPQLEQALQRRWLRAPGTGLLAAAEIDDRLLRLEAALDMPPGPEWQAARHQLKLRALKDALERGAPAPQAAAPVAQSAFECLLAVVGQAELDAARRQRLRAIVAALRQASPGALGLPADRA